MASLMCWVSRCSSTRDSSLTFDLLTCDLSFDFDFLDLDVDSSTNA